MTNHVLLIHGWSADDESMAKIGHFLKDNGFEVSSLHLGGYPSMYDDVRVEDSAKRMQEVIASMQTADPASLASRFHLIVHSTGALVARQWLADNYPDGGSPVDNFLMLAPANFGSPLATLGRSAITRIAKGWHRGFQSGTEFLHSLELGSKLQEGLALKDRLSTDGSTSSPFSDDGTRPFVIVGATPIPVTRILGLEAWDGTVRIASANINPQGMTVDFTQGRLTKPKITPWTRRGPDETPFAVLPDRNHLSILKPAPDESASDDPQTSKCLGDMIVKALNVNSPQSYKDLAKEWQGICDETRTLAQKGEEADALRTRILGNAKANKSRFNEYYQIVVEAVDEAGLPIDDFEVWLTAPTKFETNTLSNDQDITEVEIDARANLLKDEHKNRRNPERRVLHLDRRALLQQDGFFNSVLKDDHARILVAGITAVSPGDKIAYFTKDSKQGSGLIPLRAEDKSDRFLRRYSTHFIRVIIPRVLDDDVFAVRTMS